MMDVRSLPVGHPGTVLRNHSSSAAWEVTGEAPRLLGLRAALFMPSLLINLRL